MRMSFAIRLIRVASIPLFLAAIPIATTGAVDNSRSELGNLIASKAAAYGVPANLADAVVEVESDYNPKLTGRAGEVGLMQIKFETAQELGYTGTREDLYDPATNLEWGMRYLAGARDLAGGDLCRTVLKYQAGHNANQMSRAASIYCDKVKTIIASR